MATNRSAEEWRRLVSEWRGSGLPCKTFASARGVHPHTLSWWAWRLGPQSPVRSEARGCAGRSTAPTAGAGAPGFVEVVVSDAVTIPREFVVEVGDLRVRVPVGFDACELRRLVGALC